jgi:hypothetical protein
MIILRWQSFVAGLLRVVALWAVVVVVAAAAAPTKGHGLVPVCCL